MTLFKKVFGNHAVGSPEAPITSEMDAGFELSDATGDDIVAKLARATGGDEPEMPAIDGLDEILADEAMMSEPAFPEPAQAAPPQDAPPLAEPTMAERAAEAQKQIELSQQRYAFKQNPHDDIPMPDFEEETTAPRAPETLPESDAPVASTPPAPAPSPASATSVPPARPGRSGRRARTRLLGFDQGDDASNDPFEKAATNAVAPAQAFPVGWFVITDGPGKGQSFAIFNGASSIGRGDDQAIRLDFGDNSISRENHAAVAYDDEQNKFYLGHGGKSNIIRLNGRPVLSTEDLSHADEVRIGETTLRFVALCGEDFKWGTASNDCN